ncbi:MAG: HEPN domain-containing protein [Hydrogenobaculum sp.]
MALEFLKSEQDYADVVREAQEVVELLLKALIMAYGLDIPKVHDVSKFIEENLNVFPDIISSNITKIKQISRTLRKEREISFYGMEDFIPSEEYTKEDAEQAINWAREIKDIVEKALT